MNISRSHFLRLIAAAGALPLVQTLHCASTAAPEIAAPEPLPSWNPGQAKSAILDFVRRTTTPGSPDFIAVEDRIATFDNDGTLWAEQPIIQVLAMQTRLETLAAADPALRQTQPFQAALVGDAAYFATAGEAALMQVIALTSANQTDAEFAAQTAAFFATATYPRFNQPVTAMVYQPMQELLTYLRAHAFQTWICSGGGIDFMRVISQPLYGIPPQQVIGSSLQKEYREVNGTGQLWRLAEIGRINDKAGKPVGIDLHIGKRPVIAVGNVRSGGDIAMLSYSQGAPEKSLQLLVNHDDGEREFAYQEPDNASLNAANANGWQVISMKNDWKTIFAFQQ
jgi:haloacid dehalogenase-like hydrolase